MLAANRLMRANTGAKDKQSYKEQIVSFMLTSEADKHVVPLFED